MRISQEKPAAFSGTGVPAVDLDPAERSPSRRTVYWWLCLFGAAVTMAISGGHHGALDTDIRQVMAHQLWTTGDFGLPPGYWEGETTAVRSPLRDARYPVTWGLGQSLLMLPGDVAGSFVARRLGMGGERGRRITNLICIFLTFPLLNGLALVAGAFLLERLGVAFRHAVGAMGLCFLSTSLLVYAKHHFVNLQVFAAITGGTALMLSARGLDGVGFWARAIAGMSLLIAAPLIVSIAHLDAAFAAVFVIFLSHSFRPRDGLADRALSARTLSLLAVLAVGAGLLLNHCYDLYRFGEPSMGVFSRALRSYALSMGLPESWPYCVPWTTGLLNPLVGSKPLWLYDPLILLVLIMPWWRAHAALRAWIAGALGMVLFLAFFFARYVNMDGGMSWGSRYLLNPVWYGFIATTAWTLQHWTRLERWRRRAFVAFIGTSCVVQLAGISLVHHIDYLPGHHFSVFAGPLRQRFVNLWTHALGRPLFMNESVLHWNFLPGNAARSLPPSMIPLVWVVWLGFVSLAVACGFRLRNLLMRVR